MIGQRLDRYTILKSIGTGCMGTVYKAEDTKDGRLVALKLIRSQVLHSREKREQFLQYLLDACQVHHQGICRILDIGDDEDDFFVVTPFIEGRTLEQVLDRKPLPWQAALSIGIAVAEALQAAHSAGAIHRALKSSNVWIQPDGSVVLSDCGLARSTEVTRKSRAAHSGGAADHVGTPIPMTALAYMSPEQIRGDSLDPRTDVFSFGALLYEMLTGRHPFEGRSSASRMSAILTAEPAALSSKAGPVPPELERVVSRALAKDPADRFQNITDVLAELYSVQDSEPAEDTLGPETDSRTTYWWPVLALVLLILCAVAALILTRA